jgi:hypothetical protein
MAKRITPKPPGKPYSAGVRSTKAPSTPTFSKAAKPGAKWQKPKPVGARTPPKPGKPPVKRA